MLSHYELALLASASYTAVPTGTVALDVEYDIIEREDEFIVVMPGTHPNDPLDWIRDLRVIPTYFSGVGGFLHSGFGHGGHALWLRIKDDLPKGKQITYCGHSLAGAMAEVLAAYHAAAGLPPCRLVTFGAPRVAFCTNVLFGRLVRQAKEAVAYQRAGDAVPHVPTLPLFWHSARGVTLGTSYGKLVQDHSMDNYAADLAAHDPAADAKALGLSHCLQTLRSKL